MGKYSVFFRIADQSVGLPCCFINQQPLALQLLTEFQLGAQLPDCMLTHFYAIRVWGRTCQEGFQPAAAHICFG